jgi:hypothetical protein
LLANVYCHADAHKQAEWLGDDIVAKHGAYDPHVFEFLRMIGASERGLARARKMASFPGQGVALLKSMYDTHTRLASQFAARIGSTTSPAGRCARPTSSGTARAGRGS